MDKITADIKEIQALLDKKAYIVVNLLVKKGIKIATAESCTGGMLSQYITSVSGASEIFEYGLCSYSEKVKSMELGIPMQDITAYGVVSSEVATAMAKGVAQKSGADIGVGITGIAGPSGGTSSQPVGTVYVCVSYKEKNICKDLALYKKYNSPDRNMIRCLSVLSALEFIETIVE